MVQLNEPVSREEFQDLKAVVYQHDGALRFLGSHPAASDLQVLIFLGIIAGVCALAAYKYPQAFADPV